jgi:hypothetical protein
MEVCVEGPRMASSEVCLCVPAAENQPPVSTDGRHHVPSVDGDNKEQEVEVLSTLSRSGKLEVGVRQLENLVNDVSPCSSLVSKEKLPVAEIKSKLCFLLRMYGKW